MRAALAASSSPAPPSHYQCWSAQPFPSGKRMSVGPLSLRASTRRAQCHQPDSVRTNCDACVCPFPAIMRGGGTRALPPKDLSRRRMHGEGCRCGRRAQRDAAIPGFTGLRYDDAVDGLIDHPILASKTDTPPEGRATVPPRSAEPSSGAPAARASRKGRQEEPAARGAVLACS